MDHDGKALDIVNPLSAVLPESSVTRIVNAAFVDELGVPEITPAEDKDNPVGRVPETNEYVSVPSSVATTVVE